MVCLTFPSAAMDQVPPVNLVHVAVSARLYKSYSLLACPAGVMADWTGSFLVEDKRVIIAVHCTVDTKLPSGERICSVIRGEGALNSLFLFCWETEYFSAVQQGVCHPVIYDVEPCVDF